MRIAQALLLSLMLLIGSGLAAAKGRSSSTHAAKTTSKSNATKTVPKSGSDVSVKGYTKKNGTHVQASKRTTPNGTQKDNFSTKGNVNPYTGKKGTKTAKK